MSEEVAYQPEEGITDDDKLWALLSYILTPIVPIILLLMEDKKNRPFIKAHTAQALVWGVLEVVLAVGVCITPLMFIVAIYWGIKAYQGEYVEIPVITNFVKNQGWA